MVGEHDQVIGAGGLLDRALQPLQLGIVLLQHRERVRLLDSGVVCDLVIAHEGRVADGDSFDDVSQQRCDVEVAHDDGDRAAHERVEAAAIDVLLAPLALPARRTPLEDDVPEVERDRAREAVGIGEIGEVLLRAGALPVPEHAHRRRAVGRVAGEHVAAAGAPGREQAPAVRVPPLDLSRVLRVVRDDRPPGLLLVPPEGRHVLVASQQQPRLAGPRLGGEVAFPGHDPVAFRDPANGPSSARAPRGAHVAAPARRGRRSRTGSRPGRPSGRRCGPGAPAV